MRRLLFFIFAVGCIGSTQAQNSFGKLFRSKTPFPIITNSHATFLELNDASFLVIYNVVDTSVGTNLYMQKMNLAGQVLWEKQILLPGQMEILRDAIQLPDSNIAILCTYDLGNLIYDEEAYFVKVDLDGNLKDSRALTGSGICCWDIADGRLHLTQNKKLIYTHQSYGISFTNGIVSLVDTNLNSLSGFSDNSAFYHATAFQDTANNYMSFGHETVSNQKRALFSRRNSNQSFQWTKYFRHPSTALNKTTITDDAIQHNKKFILLMHFEDTLAQNQVYLVKTNFSGDTLLTKKYSAKYIPFGIYPVGNAGYIMAATNIDSTSITSLQVVLLDSNFTIVNSQKYKYKNFNEVCWSFKPASDGSFLLASSADSASKRNIHILKINANLCVEPNPSFTLNYTTGLGAGVAGVTFINTSDFGISDSSNTAILNFGDGNSISFTGNTTTHVYANQGNYLVSLTITNACGTKTYSQLVNVPCTGQPSKFAYSSNLLTTNFSYPHSAMSYSWNFGDGGTAFTANATHTYSTSGKYKVCLTTNNTCGPIQLCDSISVTCTTPLILLPSTASACIGATLSLNAGNSGSNFLWSNGQQTQVGTFTISGTYSVSVTNSCGANAVKSVIVQFQNVPQLQLGNDTTVCKNTQLILSNLLPDTNYNYSWYLNNQLQSTGTSYYFSSFSTGLFEISLVANNGGCIDSIKQEISVNPTILCDSAVYCTPLYTSGTAQGDYIKRISLGTLNNITGGTGTPSYIDYSPLGAMFSAGQSVTLRLEFNEVNTLYYRVWIDYNQDGIFSSSEVLSSGAVNPGVSLISTSISNNAYGGLTRMRVRCANSTSSNFDACSNYTYGETEDYTLTILNGNGAPIANFTADTTHIYLNDIVNFSDLSGSTATNWEWTFLGATPNTSNLKNPSGISYPLTGCYAVKLKAGNANGFTIKTDTCYINVDISLNVASKKEEANFKLLPNPFEESFVLNYNITENEVLEIYDASGKQLKQIVLAKERQVLRIDLKSFPSGIYYLRIVSEGKLYFNEKLIKL